MMGVIARFAVVVLVASISGCRKQSTGGGDCFPGMRENMLVELELVDEYTPEGPYRWVPISAPSLPSCAARDGLDIGTYTIRLGMRQQLYDCASHPVVEVDPPLSPDIDLNESRSTPSYISAEAPHCDGWWQLNGIRYQGLDDDAFGEEAEEGEFPPIILFRLLSGCGSPCFDQFVAEVRRVVEPASDAGR